MNALGIPALSTGEWDGRELLSTWECAFLYEVVRVQGAINHGRMAFEEAVELLTSTYGVSEEVLRGFLQPQSLFVFPMMRRMAALAWSMKRSQWFKRLFPQVRTGELWKEQLLPYLTHQGQRNFTALVDLGAFRYEHMEETLKELRKTYGVCTLVLMEDRNPQFFLNYQAYTPDEDVPLNRHGPYKERWTQAQMKAFIMSAKQQGIRVLLGFWCNYAGLHLKQHRVLEGHRDNAFIQRNRAALAPIVPGSDDMNIYTFVQNEEGEEMKFATYIARQYKKIATDFGVEGLFLGDGAMGMRNFLNLDSSWNFSYLQKATYDFYQEIYQVVHDELAGEVYAYDCNGYSYDEALRRGVSYRNLLGATNHGPVLDRLVVQMYPEAWGNYMRVWDRRDQKTVRCRVETILKRTSGLERLCMLTLEIGDGVEGWRVTPKQLREQMAYFERLSQMYAFDLLGVWTNEWIASFEEQKEKI